MTLPKSARAPASKPLGIFAQSAAGPINNRLGRIRPGKLRAGRLVFGRYYRRARFHPFRRAYVVAADQMVAAHPRAAIGAAVAFTCNPRQEWADV